MRRGWEDKEVYMKKVKLKKSLKYGQDDRAWVRYAGRGNNKCHHQLS